MMMTDSLPDWFDDQSLDAPGPGKFLLTTNRYPLYYLQITKCGCTFLRNLIYYLDHDALHPAGTRIHSHEADFVKADLIPRDLIAASPYLFAVVRDPVDRFLSLYFDKIANLDSPYDEKIRARVIRAANLDITSSMGLADHQRNSLKTINWIGRNLDRKGQGRPNPHWQRQSVRLSRTEGLSPRLILLDGLSWQLPQVLSPLIPDIADKMQAVRVRNVSRKPFSRDDMLTPELAGAVASVYPQDTEAAAQVRADWGPAPKSQD